MKNKKNSGQESLVILLNIETTSVISYWVVLLSVLFLGGDNKSSSK